MRLSLSTAFAILLGLAPLSGAAQETYESASLDPNGRLHIVTTNHRDVLVPLGKDQTSFREPVISNDRRAVGASAEYPNCCTSYDIPLELVIYADGKTHRFGSGLPIFQWHFADSGTQVAFGQEPVHFACSIHYELRDVRSERLLDSADVPEPCGQDPDPKPVAVPKWVTELEADHK
jgi:hypothetical protein